MAVTKATKSTEPSTLKVKILRGCVTGVRQTASAGATVTLPSGKARYLIALGKAELVETKAAAAAAKPSA